MILLRSYRKRRPRWRDGLQRHQRRRRDMFIAHNIQTKVKPQRGGMCSHLKYGVNEIVEGTVVFMPLLRSLVRFGGRGR